MSYNKIQRNRFLAAITILSLLCIGANFDIGLVVESGDITFDFDAVEQINPTVHAEENPVKISLPIIYNINTSKNVSVDKPWGWDNGFNWTIIKPNTTITVTENTTSLKWEADPDNNSYLEFYVSAPTITTTSEIETSSYYEKNLTVESPNHLENVTANTTINNSYQLYNLYWHDGSTFVDKTSQYSLQINNNTATFSGFHTSNQRFSIQGYCQESWSCTSWSQGDCGTRICTDANSCGTTINKPAEVLECESSGSSGGGGGSSSSGGFIVPSDEPAEVTYDVDVLPDTIILDLQRGENITHPLTIQSNTQQPLNLNIVLLPLDSFLSLNTKTLKLDPGESEIIKLNAAVPLTKKAGTYLFQITIKDEDYEKIVEVVVHVYETDIERELKLEREEIEAGEELSLNYKVISLTNKTGQADAVFYIRDGDYKKILYRDKIKIDLAKQKINKDLKSDIPEGEYELCVDLSVGDDIYTDCKTLKVKKTPKIQEPTIINHQVNLPYIGGILLLIVIIAGITGILVSERKKKYLFGIPRDISSREELANYIKKINSGKFKQLLQDKNSISRFVYYKLKEEELGRKLENFFDKDTIIELLLEKKRYAVNQEKIQEEKKKTTKTENEQKEKIIPHQNKDVDKQGSGEEKPESPVKPEGPEKQEDVKEQEEAQQPSEPVKPTIDLSRQAPTGQTFKVSNGVELKNIQDLKEYLHVMPEDSLKHHVNKEKNDFANWIEGVFKETKLADKLRTSTDRQQQIRIIEEHTRQKV